MSPSGPWQLATTRRVFLSKIFSINYSNGTSDSKWILAANYHSTQRSFNNFKWTFAFKYNSYPVSFQPKFLSQTSVWESKIFQGSWWRPNTARFGPYSGPKFFQRNFQSWFNISPTNLLNVIKQRVRVDFDSWLQLESESSPSVQNFFY